MRWALAGEDYEVIVPFTRDGDTFVPDSGTVYYTIRRNDGTPHPAYTDVAVDTGLTTVQAAITVPATIMAITGRFEGRTVTVKARQGNRPWITSVHFQVTGWLNHRVDAAKVRGYLGVNERELRDEDLDLVTAYFQVEEDIGRVPFETALASGTMDAARANEAVMLRAVLDVLPGIELRVAAEETDGMVGFSRFAKVDFAEIRAQAQGRYNELISAIGTADVLGPVLFILSTQPDPITAGA